MADKDSQSLTDLLFGPPRPEEDKREGDLAEVISAWYRAGRAWLRNGATFGTQPAESFPTPPPQLRGGSGVGETLSCPVATDHCALGERDKRRTEEQE
jgi:hypothetical protein